MSDFSEQVLAAITDEWQYTREICDKVPQQLDTESHRAKVRKHLRGLLSRGLVERRDSDYMGIPFREWRLKR